MKILMVVLHFPPAPCGGAETQCWKQAKALAARGHEVTVLTGWFQGGSPRREFREGVEIRRLGFLLPATVAVRRAHRRLRLWASPPRADRPDPFSADASRESPEPSRRKFRWMAPVEWAGHASFVLEVALAVGAGRLRADVVHVHETHWLAGFGQWIGERLGAPVFCKEACGEVMHWPGVRDVPFLSRWKRRRARCLFLALTPHIRAELQKAGIAPDRIRDVPNGVELPGELAAPEKSGEVLYAGNFTQGATYKGFDVLLKAWGRARREEPGMRLRLHGGGDAERWRQVAEREGCGDSVEFAGRAGDMQEQYRRAGFLVLPSRVEGLSNVLLEAQAAGLPAVVSDIGGNVAVVEDGRNGLVVPVGDADALAGALVRLYRDPELRRRMGREARARMEAEFAIGKVAERLEALYEEARRRTAGGDGSPDRP